ncbi:cobalamin-binding protein, partial [Bordetella pertussis]
GAAGAAPVRVVDDQRRTVELAQPARRAIALAPHAAELVYAAGAGDRLVGAVRGTDYPPAARQLPSVGDAMQPDPERIAVLRPDLLIGWQPAAGAPLAPIAARLGAALYYSDPRTLADIPAAIEQLGRLFGTEAQADAGAAALRARLAALAARYAGKAPVRVFVQAGTDPLFTLNDHSIVGDVLRLCGGVNVYGQAPILAPQVTLEGVLAARPDAIVAGVTGTADAAATLRAWQTAGVPAALRGHVYGIDADSLYRPTGRLIDAAEQLCARLDEARG